MEIKQAIDAIESKFNDFDVKADVLLGDIPGEYDRGVELVAYLDPTKVTMALVNAVRAFNADATNTIEFVEGKTLYRENIMYIMIFKISTGCGGI